ncbi:MAG: PQQ-binding-like beta-propeller repeat protein [Planctomycetota bacterium]
MTLENAPPEERMSGPTWSRPRTWQVALAVLTAFLTIGLSYPWGYTLINWMLVGKADGRMLAVFAGVLGLVMILASLLAAMPSITPYRGAIGRAAILLFTIANVVIVYLRVDARPPMPLVIAIYAIGNLWVVWLALFALWPLRISRKIVALAVLVGIEISFTRLFRVEGLTGDANVEIAWRRAPTVLDESKKLPTSESSNTVFEEVTWTETPQDFPQYLGPHRNGVLAGPPLARDWSASPPKLLWKQQVGAGWGAFAVVGDFAVTQEQRGELESVVCYETATGKERWIHADKENFDSSLGGPGPRATPTIHQGRVYTMGPKGLLNCLDGSTGKTIWSVRVLENPASDNIAHGVCGSPMILDNKVIVSPTSPDGLSLAAYSMEDGSPLWKKGKPGTRGSYGSPMLASLGGTPQVLLFNGHGVAGHDAQTGEVLWFSPLENNYNTNCSQPIVLAGNPDRVFASTGYGAGAKLFAVSKESDNKWGVEEIWSSKGLKCKFTSPVIIGDYAYGLDEGILACLDLKAGKQKWKRGRYGHGQVLLVGDLLLVLSEKGEMVLVEPKPEKLIELGKFAAIEGKTWNTIALAGNRLLVRNDHEAACYELPLATQ